VPVCAYMDVTRWEEVEKMYSLENRGTTGEPDGSERLASKGRRGFDGLRLVAHHRPWSYPSRGDGPDDS
jgi:hypothetical protein